MRMSDLIDRQALKNKLKRWDERDPYEFVEIALHAVDDAPTIDAMPVVRCRECKHRDPENKGCDCAGHEMLMGGFLPMPDDWFCADGEREVQDADT